MADEQTQTDEQEAEAKPEQKHDHRCGACAGILPADTPCSHERPIFCGPCKKLSHFQRSVLVHLHTLVMFSAETADNSDILASMVYDATGPHDEDDETKEDLVQ